MRNEPDIPIKELCDMQTVDDSGTTRGSASGSSDFASPPPTPRVVNEPNKANNDDGGKAVNDEKAVRDEMMDGAKAVEGTKTVGGTVAVEGTKTVGGTVAVGDTETRDAKTKDNTKTQDDPKTKDDKPASAAADTPLPTRIVGGIYRRCLHSPLFSHQSAIESKCRHLPLLSLAFHQRSSSLRPQKF